MRCYNFTNSSSAPKYVLNHAPRTYIKKPGNQRSLMIFLVFCCAQASRGLPLPSAMSSDINSLRQVSTDVRDMFKPQR